MLKKNVSKILELAVSNSCEMDKEDYRSMLDQDGDAAYDVILTKLKNVNDSITGIRGLCSFTKTSIERNGPDSAVEALAQDAVAHGGVEGYLNYLDDQLSNLYFQKFNLTRVLVFIALAMIDPSYLNEEQIYNDIDVTIKNAKELTFVRH